ncbi:HAMP domain-containing protein [candidate division WOR-3 bacterium]|nr:HAMP domain-containing protein [candidate division WOR-3 bacterium]
MRRSVFLQVFGGHLLVVLVLATALLLFLLNTARTQHIRGMTDRLERFGRVVARHVEPVFDSGPAGLNAEVGELGRLSGTRITVIALDGRVLADTDEDPALMEDHSARPEIIQARQDRVGSSVRQSRTTGQEMLYVAVPLAVDGEVRAVVRSSLYITEVNVLLRALTVRVLLVAGVLVLVALGLALTFARGISRPVDELVRATRRVGAGDLDVRLSTAGRDELAELAEGFNDMVARLRGVVAQATRRQERLDRVIGSIKDGLVVLDENGRVSLANASFHDLAGERFEAGRPLWEVLRDDGLSDLVQAVGRGAATGSAEIEVGGRRFVCSASRVEVSRETVVTFHDVTEIERMARIKKDLVVNASHELRTPLTAIKGFLETMDEGMTGDNRRYLEIVMRHTERLINIVQDLLLLARLEDGPPLQTEPVDLAALAQGTLRIFERRAQEKGVGLRFESGAGMPTVDGDAFRLEQVLVNLVDNAVKYTDEGSVVVGLAAEDGWMVLRVRDTGIGIGRDQLDRVFERFYVTDKARSRKQGGTGLGLAIVKHIVLQHGGTIEVTSEPGRGSEFIVRLPLLGPGPHRAS